MTHIAPGARGSEENVKTRISDLEPPINQQEKELLGLQVRYQKRQRGPLIGGVKCRCISRDHRSKLPDSGNETKDNRIHE